MKHTLLIITALMLTIGYSQETDAKPIDGSTLVWKDGLMYIPDSDKPYSGVAVRYYGNGQKREEGTYKDGIRYEKWLKWHDNGQKSDVKNYKDGKRISSKKWNSDGSVKE